MLDMLQVVNKKAQSLLLAFSVSTADFEQVFVWWARYFRIRTTVVFVQYLFQQKTTCSNSATKTLQITDDNPKEHIFG